MLVPVWDDIVDESVRAAVRAGQRPVILRNLIQDWPLVQAGLQGIAVLSDHLLQFDQGKNFQAMNAPVSAKGSVF